MTNWTTGVCATNGINIHYVRTGGSKPPLVLLHGLTGSGACWTPLARALEDAYDVVMPDARGHGNSSAPLHGYRYDDLAGDVIGLIQGLKLAAPILLGHSMGGMTAALVASQAAGTIRNGALPGEALPSEAIRSGPIPSDAIRSETIRSVILVDPTFLSPHRQREVHESDVAEQHRRLLGLSKSDVLAQLQARHTHRSPEILELLAEARLQTQLSTFDVLTPPNPEYPQLVSNIHVPILLAIGDKTPVVSLETARELQNLNPRVRVEQIQGTGHGLPYDQPDRLGAVVRSFLGQVSPGSA
jgi:N-formylmaleamate deformylase